MRYPCRALFGLVALGATTPASAAHHGEKKDIVDVAVGAGDFNTLAAALQAAG